MTPEAPADQRVTTHGSEDGGKPTEGMSPLIQSWQGHVTVEPHEEAVEIIEQVEYYFSDTNLASDAHLLERTGLTGEGWCSLNEILSFKKLRQYKPKSRVKAAVALSDKLEVRDNKFIRRKTPLRVAPTVVPKLKEDRLRVQKVLDKPWLTKGMLKPTGLEEHSTEGPITPAEYAYERILFDPEEAFTVRIERAVNRFAKKKKMHQAPSSVFAKFLHFGGFSATPPMFTGRVDKQDLEQYTKEEIDDMQARFSIADKTLDGLHPDQAGGMSWVVDFEGMARAFLSSEFPQHFDWDDEKVVIETTTVLRKFYQYLLYHDACPEYHEDILQARNVCDMACKEFPRLAMVAQRLPGNFNIACSTLHQGKYARVRPIDPRAEWVLPEDDVGLSDRDAFQIFNTAIAAFGTDEQFEAVSKAPADQKVLLTKDQEEIGLQLVSVEYASGEAKQLYGDERLRGTIVRPMGKLHCVRWEVPHAHPHDVPLEVLQALKVQKGKKYEFIVEEEMLQYCDPGMKFEALVCELACGIAWLDTVVAVHPTFSRWTFNDHIREWKEPGPPKAWMARQNAKKRGEEEEEGQEVGVEEVEIVAAAAAAG